MNSPLSFKNALSHVILLIFFAMCFSYVYAAAGQWLKPAWLGAAVMNTFLATIVLIAAVKAPHRISGDVKPLRRSTQKKWTYLPAIFIVTSTLLLGTISSYFGQPETLNITANQWLLISWIPVVEEIVFRRGIGQYYVSKMGVIWGSYFSALLFAMAHTDLTLPSILSGNIGIPLGPFLLGFAANILMCKSRSLLAPILLHAACNSTVVILSLLDSRWFSWLYYLYH